MTIPSSHDSYSQYLYKDHTIYVFINSILHAEFLRALGVLQLQELSLLHEQLPYKAVGGFSLSNLRYYC